MQQGSVQVFLPHGYEGALYRQPYGREQPGLIQQVFGLPINIAIGESNQSLFEFSLAYAFLELAKKAIDLAGIPRTPKLGIVRKEGGDHEKLQLEEGVWSFGSPYRNPLTRLLASDQREGTISGLEANLKPELPFYFDIQDDKTVTNTGYYTKDQNLLIAWGTLEALLEKNPEIGKYLSLETALTKEPIVHIKGSNRTFIPEYNEQLQRFERDYWMMTQMYSLNPETQNLGHKDVVVAGCHDLGTRNAILALFSKGLMEEISKQVGGHPTFQVIGYTTPNEFELLEVIKF